MSSEDIINAEEAWQISSRKWRPQNFDEVVGQEVIKRELKNGIERGQIANAYLFSGPRGVGKTSMARIFSKALNCEKGPTAFPCNVCSHCVGITKGAEMDVIEIDGASYTKVENIRDLQEGVNRAPYSARYKVYIIDEVHMLSTSSFNALLKTLEEPPRHVVFIFATTNPEKIPETVISRCRHYEFKRIETADIAKRLELILDKAKDVSVSPAEKKQILEAIALSSEGGMRDAQVTLDQLLTLSDGKITLNDAEQLLGTVYTNIFFQIIHAIARKDTKELLLIIHRLSESGKDFERLVKSLIQFIRDLMILRAGGEQKLVSLFSENLAQAKKLANDLSYPFILNLLNQFFIVEEKLKTTTLPARFLLEFTLIKLTAIEPAIDIDHVLRELKAFPDSGALNLGYVAPCVSSAPLPPAAPDESNPFSQPTETLLESSPEAGDVSSAPEPLQRSAEEENSVNERTEQYSAPQVLKPFPAKSAPKELTADGIWVKIQKELKMNNMPLFSTFTNAKEMTVENDTLVLKFSESYAFKRTFEDKENLKYIEDLLTKTVGRDFKVRPVFEKDSASSPQPTNRNENDKASGFKAWGASGVENFSRASVEEAPALAPPPPKFKRSSGAIDPDLMKKINETFRDEPETYQEAASLFPDFKEKVEFVEKRLGGKLTHFNKKPVKK